MEFGSVTLKINNQNTHSSWVILKSNYQYPNAVFVEFQYKSSNVSLTSYLHWKK
jgi:hypothetical protein